MNPPTDWRKEFKELCDKYFGDALLGRRDELIDFITSEISKAKREGRERVIGLLEHPSDVDARKRGIFISRNRDEVDDFIEGVKANLASLEEDNSSTKE